jgi:hypothetical protein
LAAVYGGPYVVVALLSVLTFPQIYGRRDASTIRVLETAITKADRDA